MTKIYGLLQLIIIYTFYCVNTSYPMDNCFTGRRDRSRQTPEKDVLYIIPAGPVSCVHSLGGASYLLPVQTEWRQFIFFVWRVLCADAFWIYLQVWRKRGLFYEFKAYFHLEIYILCYIHIRASPGLKRGIIQCFISQFWRILCTCHRRRGRGWEVVCRPCSIPSAV